MLLTYKDCFVLLDFVQPHLTKFEISNLGIEYLHLSRLLKNCQHYVKEFEQKRNLIIDENIAQFVLSQQETEDKEFAELVKMCIVTAFRNSDELNNFIDNNEQLKPLKEKLNELINILGTAINKLFIEKFEISINFSQEEVQRLYNQFKIFLKNEELLQFDFLLDN